MTLNPRFVGNLRFLAASLAASGQVKEAREVGRALLRVNPSFSAVTAARPLAESARCGFR
jgi:adenylate cyclase